MENQNGSTMVLATIKRHVAGSYSAEIKRGDSSDHLIGGTLEDAQRFLRKMETGGSRFGALHSGSRPAASAMLDSSGSSVRLECVKLLLSSGVPPERVQESAAKLSGWVLSGAPPGY